MYFHHLNPWSVEIEPEDTIYTETVMDRGDYEDSIHIETAIEVVDRGTETI